MQVLLIGHVPPRLVEQVEAQLLAWYAFVSASQVRPMMRTNPEGLWIRDKVRPTVRMARSLVQTQHDVNVILPRIHDRLVQPLELLSVDDFNPTVLSIYDSQREAARS